MKKIKVVLQWLMSDTVELEVPEQATYAETLAYAKKRAYDQYAIGCHAPIETRLYVDDSLEVNDDLTLEANGIIFPVLDLDNEDAYNEGAFSNAPCHECLSYYCRCDITGSDIKLKDYDRE